MTTTPTSIPETDSLGESWVELNSSSARTTPLPFPAAEEYLRLLREAQRESNHSSARVSLASSLKGSPKSPPNSPNTELVSVEEELQGVYINYSNKDAEWVEKNTDWIWDWSSRPDQEPPKDWKFRRPKVRKMLSIRTAKVGKMALFSREMMYTLLITNVLSLLLGSGIGEVDIPDIEAFIARLTRDYHDNLVLVPGAQYYKLGEPTPGRRLKPRLYQDIHHVLLHGH